MSGLQTRPLRKSWGLTLTSALYVVLRLSQMYMINYVLSCFIGYMLSFLENVWQMGTKHRNEPKSQKHLYMKKLWNMKMFLQQLASKEIDWHKPTSTNIDEYQRISTDVNWHPPTLTDINWLCPTLSIIDQYWPRLINIDRHWPTYRPIWTDIDRHRLNNFYQYRPTSTDVDKDFSSMMATTRRAWKVIDLVG